MDKPQETPVLLYGAECPINKIAIRAVRDGIVVTTKRSAFQHWAGLLGHLLLVITLLTIACLPHDNIEWYGAQIHREGRTAQIVSAIIGVFVLVHFVKLLFSPRLPFTLTARAGNFSYSSPKMFGIRVVEMPLADITNVTLTPEDCDGGGVRLEVFSVATQTLQLFPNQTKEELGSVAEALTAVWKSAVESGRV